VKNYKDMNYPLVLIITSIVILIMISMLVAGVTGAVLLAYATPDTILTVTPHVTIAFVGNILPTAGKDYVSIAGMTTHNAANTMNIEPQAIVVYWGDGSSSQSKITRISSSSSSSYAEGKWGPLYHMYEYPNKASHPYVIVATMKIPSHSSSSAGQGFAQIKSESYLINVNKDPLKVSSSYTPRDNNAFLLNSDHDQTSGLLSIIAFSVFGSFTACSLCMIRNRRRDQNITSTMNTSK
jgi:hypothetical protein